MPTAVFFTSHRSTERPADQFCTLNILKYGCILRKKNKKKFEIGKAACVRHHPPRVRSAPAAISGGWTSGTLCLAPLSFPRVAGWIAGSSGSLKPNLFSAEREPARLTCHRNSSAEVTSICSSTKRRRERLVRELDSCLLSAETSRTSWICCVLISVGPCRGSARLHLANGVCGTDTSWENSAAWVTCCVSATPRRAQNLNIAVKTGDGNRQSWINLPNMAKKFQLLEGKHTWTTDCKDAGWNLQRIPANAFYTV